MTKADEKHVEGSRLLKAVEAIAISPADAAALVTAIQRRVSRDLSDPKLIRAATAKAVVARYSRLAATVGGATGLTGLIPGIGTVVAMVGGATADAAVSMKLQIDMCICLAYAYEVDVPAEEVRHLGFLIAAGGALENAGAPLAVELASKAGVRLIREYLKGAALQAVKEFFKKLGIIFTRKALEKALPFGVGVVIGASANYALTRYVGSRATQWFDINAELPSSERVG